MEERAAMLNGTLTIVSKPEIGTEVKLVFPAKKVELEKV
jgi:signal transduction histidine kinase